MPKYKKPKKFKFKPTIKTADQLATLKKFAKLASKIAFEDAKHKRSH